MFYREFDYDSTFGSGPIPVNAEEVLSILNAEFQSRLDKVDEPDDDTRRMISETLYEEFCMDRFTANAVWEEDADQLNDAVNDYVFDHNDELSQEYELSDYTRDENGNLSCRIKFTDDKHVYTIVMIDGNIYLYA